MSQTLMLSTGTDTRTLSTDRLSSNGTTTMSTRPALRESIQEMSLPVMSISMLWPLLSAYLSRR